MEKSFSAQLTKNGFHQSPPSMLNLQADAFQAKKLEGNPCKIRVLLYSIEWEK